MATLTECKQQLAALLGADTAVDSADTNLDVHPDWRVAHWATAAAAGRALLLISVQTASETEGGLGCVSDQQHVFRIDAYMRYESAPASTPGFDALLDRLRDTLRGNRSLKTTVDDMGLPQLTRYDSRQYSGEPDTPVAVTCHRATLQVTIYDRFNYTTS